MLAAPTSGAIQRGRVAPVGVAGFEPALCLLPKQVPYQARRHTENHRQELEEIVVPHEPGFNPAEGGISPQGSELTLGDLWRETM